MLIVALTTVAVVTGVAALMMTTRDFRRGSTFRRATAVMIYLAWATHAAALAAAVVTDPYRVEVPIIPATTVGAPFMLLGVALFVLGMARFQSFEQVTGTEVGRLVTSGAYRFSRNPQYTGWISVLVGIAVLARSPLAFGLAVAVVVAMRIWIPHEERHLEDQFGDEYRQYRDSVPRVIGVSRDRQTAH